MKYIVVDGSFRDSDGSIKGPGEVIELDEDMAAFHAGRVRPTPAEDAAQEKAPEASPVSVQAPALSSDADSSDAEHS